MTNKEALFTSNSDEWTTPKDLFNKLNNVFSFGLDSAATNENKLCENFLDDAIHQSWEGQGPVWCNPPYSMCKEFVEKALTVVNEPIVMLVPSRTDTKWFHKLKQQTDNVILVFIKGRLKFSESKNSAPFPSMLIVLNSSLIVDRLSDTVKLFNGLGSPVLMFKTGELEVSK